MPSQCFGRKPFHMKQLILIGFILTVLLAFKQNQTSVDTGILTCTLQSDKKLYKVGELPKFNVEIINNSEKDIYLIGSLDGSAIKGRFPYCYYSILKPKPEKINSTRCGNMNTLRPNDFKLVKAGQKFNPYEHIDIHGFFDDNVTTNLETFKHVGIYKIRFYYSTNSTKFDDFLGDKPFRKNDSNSVIIHGFFKSVPKVEIASNEIEIRIEE